MNTQQEFPLTPLQHAMLMHTVSAPEDGVYVQQKILCLPHEVDPDQWRRGLHRLCERHPVLRTVFRLDDPRAARQYVLPEPVVSLSSLDCADEQEFAGFLAVDRGRPFDVQGGPAQRFALGRVGAEARFVWTSHHALMDGRSYAIVLQELCQLYDGATDLPLRTDFSVYVDWLARQDYRSAAVYWRQRLAGAEVPTPLPGSGYAARPPGGESFTSVVVEVAEGITAGLERLVSRHDVTMSTAVQAAWAVVLGAHCGRTDVVFGVTKSCRSFHPGGADMVGLLINTLPLRVDVAAAPTVPELLVEVRSGYLALRRVEYTPLNRVLEWCGIPRGSSLFDTVVVFESQPPAARLRALGGEWQHRRFRLEERAHSPVTVTVYQDRRLTVRLGSDRRCITDLQAHQLLDDLRAVLAAMTDRPEGRTADLMAAEPARREVRRGAVGASPRRQCASQLFSEQARLRPAAVAVRARGQCVTYEQLDRQASRLAAYLGARGVGPGHRVGVCLPRSVDLMVALLAVMKSGAAYVPLDPLYPPYRVTYMVADAGVRVVLANRDTVAGLAGLAPEVVDVDGERDLIDAHRTGPVDRAQAGNLAYVIYTSGSTGRPKGVAVTHRALANLLCSMARTPGCGAGDRLLAVTTVCFDIAGLELFLPLTTGAQVIVAEAEAAADGYALCELLRLERPTIMQATPATWRMLLAAGWAGAAELTVLCGGEALARDLADALVARTGRVWNVYGPTETTIWSSISRVRPSEPITLGRPIANTRFYVLDERMRPVPDGVDGELYIGGDGVAEGYLGRPELTAQKFVADPFTPGRRLYRSGDLVHRRPDGTFAYLGRIDRQVKVHGYRIEPGEIEVVLREHPAVGEAVVVSQEGPTGARLVAYAVPEPGQRFSPEHLRAWLAARLPSYMLPAVISSLTSIPRTLNNKIDYAALPLPVAAARGGQPQPGTATERAVAAVWQRLLRLEHPDVDTNFFDAGGDSLLLMHLVKVLRELGHPVTRVDVFAYPTIRTLSACLDAVPTGPAAQEPRSAQRALERRRRRIAERADHGEQP